ncbi:MAG: protein kinase, partial [archaeon]|nr:protein kinase [archaeon]
MGNEEPSVVSKETPEQYNKEEKEAEEFNKMVKSYVSVKESKKEINHLLRDLLQMIPKEYVSMDKKRFNRLYRTKKNLKAGDSVLYKLNIIEKKETGQLYIAKTITKERIEAIGKEKFKILFASEMKFFYKVRITGVETLYKVYVSQEINTFRIILITNYVHPKSLLDIINEKIENKEKFDYTEIQQISRSLVKTLLKLQSKRVIFRNFAPENIYFLKEGDYRSLSIRNCFFSHIASLTDSYSTGKFGGLWYMSPEMIKDIKYDNKADVWAIGIIIYTLVALENPFSECESVNMMILKQKKKETEIFNFDFLLSIGVKGEIINFIKGMIQKESKNRSSVEVLNNDPFLNSNMQSASELRKYNRWVSERLRDFVAVDESFLSELTSKLFKNKATKTLHAFVFYIVYICRHFLGDQEEFVRTNISYNILDQNSDGIVSMNEVKKMLMEKIQEDPATLDKEGKSTLIQRYLDYLRAVLLSNKYIIQYLKVERDHITYEMFVTAHVLYNIMMKKNDEDYIKRIMLNLFDEIDEDLNGIISFRELKNFLALREDKMMLKDTRIMQQLIEAETGLNFKFLSPKDLRSLLVFDCIQLDKDKKMKINQLKKAEEEQMKRLESRKLKYSRPESRSVTDSNVDGSQGEFPLDKGSGSLPKGFSGNSLQGGLEHRLDTEESGAGPAIGRFQPIEEENINEEKEDEADVERRERINQYTKEIQDADLEEEEGKMKPERDNEEDEEERRRYIEEYNRRLQAQREREMREAQAAQQRENEGEEGENNEEYQRRLQEEYQGRLQEYQGRLQEEYQRRIQEQRENEGEEGENEEYQRALQEEYQRAL